MVQNDHKIKGSNVLILGITFKENCPDILNTKVVDIYNELIEFSLNVDVYDPWAESDLVMCEFGIQLLKKINVKKKYKAIIVAVPHSHFLKIDFKNYYNKGTVIFDTKAFIDRQFVSARL
jgi:UDP-N-acetyl-D-galactosamine dehydrogenase